MCVESLLKIVVFIVNFLCGLAGIALITVGALYISNSQNFTDAIPEEFGNLSVAPILTIVIGCIIFVVSFFGCFGAFCSNPCMLTTYSVFLLILFLLQIAVGIYATVKIKDEDALKTEVHKSIDKLIGNYDKNKEVVDFLQQELHCCGVDGRESYGFDIPDSCRENIDSTSSSYYTEGCANAFSNFLHDKTQIIGIVTLSISAVEIIGSVFGLCLANLIRNGDRRSHY